MAISEIYQHVPVQFSIETVEELTVLYVEILGQYKLSDGVGK